MSAVFAFPRTRRTAVALILCLLAFAFAMEAKLACYGPSHGLDNVVHAAKACPADTPDVLAQRIPVLSSTQAPVFPLLFVVFALIVRSATAPRLREIAAARGSVFAAYFFHPLFFRPPPSFR